MKFICGQVGITAQVKCNNIYCFLSWLICSHFISLFVSLTRIRLPNIIDRVYLLSIYVCWARSG